MLRITQSSHVNAAKTYYSSGADYYSEGQELAGRWRGKAAAMLGLEGTIRQEDWDALCENVNPRTGKRLTLRTNFERRVGYDFNFHAPKSVSLLYAMTRDERILHAFRDSVDETMRSMETEMASRVRKKAKNENRVTGNMVWGEYIHFTSRPVNGTQDPHLHAHAFCFNVTHDDHENAWKAGQFGDIKRDGSYFEAVFHARFAHRLAELGLPIERNKKSWELAGVNRTLIETFSRRTQQIEERARERGIDDPEEKAELGAKTRQSKQKDVTLPELQHSWRERMTGQEFGVLAELADKIGGGSAPRDGNASARAMEYALGHAFERRSVTPEREVLAIALKQAVGQATVEQVLDRAARSELIIGERNGRRMATTREVLKEERRVIDKAKAGRGACRPLVGKRRKPNREWLSDEQKKAVEHITGSRDRYVCVRGAAGVGKTTLLQEALEQIEEAGKKVFAFAPSAEASRETLRKEGFKDADTVSRLLVDEKLQQRVAGQVALIDEAGLLSMKSMDRLFSLAERHDWRVVLVGDSKQHASVERGSPLRLLEEEAGLIPAQLKEIRRQSDEYKSAVKAMSEGRVAEGFQRLDDLGWIRELPEDERYRQLASDYVQALAEKRTVLAISPTHAEGRQIDAAIRDALRKKGKLGTEERAFRVLENANLTEAERGDAVNYASGDVLVFHQNAKGGITRGQKVTVGDVKSLPLEQAARFQAFHASTLMLAEGDRIRITHNGQTADRKHTLSNGAIYEVDHFDRSGNIVLTNDWIIDKDFGHLAHGYVVTSHASQSKTVQRVFVAQSPQSLPASSREQFYVSCSRGKERVTVYTDEKEALREAISESDERLSATEFVNGGRHRQIDAERALDRAITAAQQEKEREGPGYDR